MDWLDSLCRHITTAIFFVGMWLMARRKIENWIFWIIGDIISVPLYFYKGFTFTSLQYLGIYIYCHFWLFSMEEKYKQQPANCIKVVLFGPESTGKTTLSRQLARHYNSVWVSQNMRVSMLTRKME